jgi:hypothetical protein
MAYDQDVAQRVTMLREHYTHRDAVATRVLHVRRGDWDKVDPDAFNEQYPRPIVANVIDEQARHATAALSPMPMIRCRASVNSASQRAKDRADKRTKIVNHYFDSARVEDQMQIGADQFYTFGMIVAEIVPNFERQMPEIRVRQAQHVYPVWDSQLRTVEVAQVFEKRCVDLIAQYPEAAYELREHSGMHGRTHYEVYRHDDGKNITVMIPSIGEGLVLHKMENPIGRCLTVCVAKHTVDGYIRGAFDDLIWAQLARNEVQMLTLEGIRDAIEAPFVLPTDVANVAIGPKAVIRTNNPQGARRLPMEVSPQAFGAIEHYEAEMHKGAISPPALGGSIDASVVTGKGVQELMGGYSQQIAMDQQTLMGFFREAAAVCILMDIALWPDVKKKCEGVKNGSDYDFTYTPESDLEGKTAVDVNYGTSTGMDPNRHVVYLLQLLSAQLYSKDTVLRQLPGNINATDELSKVAVEQSRDALLAAVQGMAQSVASLAANGAPPEVISEVVFKVAAFTDALEKGEPIEEVAKKIFAPPEPVEQAPTAEAAVAEGAPPEDALAALMGGGGPGGAPAAPGGGPVDASQPPDTGALSTFFGNLQGGGANLQASGKIKTPF